MRNWLFLFACNLMWALQFTCIKLVEDQVGPYMTVWGPMLIATIGPVFTAVMAMLILKEKMNTARWISFAMAIIGVLVLSGKDIQGASFGFEFLAGNLLILGSILANSLNNSFGKVILRRYTPMEMMFWSYLLMVILLIPFVAPEFSQFFSTLPSFTIGTWLGLLSLSFFHNYLSMILFLKALSELDAIQAALSNYLITFFGVPIAAFTLGEKLGPLAVLGGILVLGSTLLITLWERKEQAAAVAALNTQETITK